MPDSAPSPPRLDIRDLHRVFGGHAVVEAATLSIGAGECLCLLGPSGCGKSTTLRMIAGVERPDAGEVRLDGVRVSAPGLHVPPEARSVGLMFQDFALFPHLNVARNVAFGLDGPRPARHARAMDLLERVGMARFAAAFPHELSGGEQQRVALARALAPRPRLMLMDEPFSGLDNRLRDGIRDQTLALLREEGTAVLMVTHEPEEAMRMADRIVLMRAGRIVQTGAPHEVYNRPVDRAAAAFFSDINLLQGRVRNGAVATPLGSFAAPGLAEGEAAEVVSRPQHLEIGGHGAARGRVLRARFLGRESLVEFVLEGDGPRLQAMVPGMVLPAPGEVFALGLRPENCHVFARTG
ncbi:ABC transporter ATP-binding protein [Mangrovicoccus algicola]|uniref:ABC transporter ATP-binding protein n=1 Tax=Mangrovicoccus algicola TaxID=2771008 RepID=A0A8J6Z2L0_9RHOB|nr:ABC transporter ATP-binding protein [Mangrovicoccus algicola]MBE3640553.1 ABC transporter ATP-binding protein [Mangrovicoccus algicola]